jgi:[acyl-carrier-protein] S-malonyltransferase
MKAFVFPGQGSQKVGMAAAMVEKFPWAADMAKKADEIMGYSLSKICFEGPEEELKKTVNTQPAIFLSSAILIEWCKKNGVDFNAVAGHSLGEYSALYAASVASFKDLLTLVKLRAEAMEKACPAGTGAMSAILKLNREQVQEICDSVADEGVCVIANCNCPGQLVISGAANAVAKAGELAKEKGARKVVALEVSGPFHSPLMSNAKELLEVAIKNIEFSDAKVPVYTNVDGMPTTDASSLKQKLLDQLTGSVLWEDSVAKMVADGTEAFVELGSAKVLAGLNKKIAPSVPTTFAKDPESLEKLLMTSQAG